MSFANRMRSLTGRERRSIVAQEECPGYAALTAVVPVPSNQSPLLRDKSGAPTGVELDVRCGQSLQEKCQSSGSNLSSAETDPFEPFHTR
jgi:hypothetical protein